MLPLLNLLPTSARPGLPINADRVPPYLRKEANDTNSESSSSDYDSDSRSDSDSSSESESDSENMPRLWKDEHMLHRSFLNFAVSQDEKNPSLLSRWEFAKLDLYEVDFDQDASGVIQSATRYFPCHVFWNLRTTSGDYKVWGQPTQTPVEQESVIAMLEKQRVERLEYRLVVNERKWKEDCDRQCRNQRLEISAEGATQRASTRRASEEIQDAKRFEAVALEVVAAARADRERLFGNRGGLNPVPSGRIATILHRIHRREGATELTEERAEVLINSNLKRLGMKALVLGGFALVSAVAYLQRLQEQPVEQPVEQEPDASLLQRIGILESPFHLGASVNNTTVTRAKRPGVTDKCLSTNPGY